jgi:hypothetical protein
MAARAQQLANAGRQAQNARQSSQALGGLGKTVNATNAIRARQSSQALGGFGKVASGAGNLVKKYPKLAAGVAGGAALGGFAATQLGNNPPPSTAATNKTGPSFEKTGRGNAPAQTNLKPANVMSAKPSFEFSDKQREAAKKGKAGIKDVQAWAQSRGIKADPSSKEILRNYLNAAQNKTMKTDVKAGGTAATSTQTAAQSAELKMKAGMAQRSGPSVAAKPTPSATPNVQPARNSTLAAPSAMANRPNVQPARNSTLAAPSAMAAAPRVDAKAQGFKVSNKPAMGMSFTPKTTQASVQEPAKSVTPQMSQTRTSLDAKAALAGKERGFSPTVTRTEINRRENIQKAKGA